jgi:hypothetical protein
MADLKFQFAGVVPKELLLSGHIPLIAKWYSRDYGSTRLL